MSGFLDMTTAAQSTSVAATAFGARPSARQKANKRRSHGARTATAAAIHGSIANVGAGLYKSFRERFVGSGGGGGGRGGGGGVGGSGSSSIAGDYRPLRQRDAEAGIAQNEFLSSASSEEESLQESSDSLNGSTTGSSAEDLFISDLARRQSRRKKPSVQRQRRRRKLRQLQDLLNPRQRRGGGQDSSSSDDDEESLVVNKMTPGRIGAPASGDAGKAGAKAKGKKKVNLVATPLEEPPQNQPSTLEEWQEAQEREDADILETRKCPEYTTTYRQAVGTEDVFLQMGQRTAASASCEDLVLEIDLPGEQMSVDKMSLTLHEKELDLGTSLYRLKLPLPHAVDVDRCHAQYDKEVFKLRLTLRLRRELDFVNF